MAAQETKPPLQLKFEVDCATALTGRVRVTMNIEHNEKKDLSVSIPIWAPGSYRVQNFQKNLENVTALAAGKPAKLEVVNDWTWTVKAGGAETVTVLYDVKVGANNRSDTWYDCIGPATFMYVVGHKESPCSVVFKTPKDWKQLNGLTSKDGGWHGPDYDTFIDQPTMLGFFEVLEFKQSGALFQLACCGPLRDANDFGLAFDTKSLKVVDVVKDGPGAKAGIEKGDVITSAAGRPAETVKDLAKQAWKLFEEEKLEVELDGKKKVTITLPRRIDGARLSEVHEKLVAPHIKVYGGVPFERYVFLNYFKRQAGGGGLEHLFSCHIDFPYESVRRDPNSIASLNSHEFVHLWNVKRIRPFELGPFDYTKPVPSKHLWLAEGCTSYYGDLALARSKVWDESRYFSHLTGTIDQVTGSPEYKGRSLEEQSESAQWGAKPQSYFYYAKGELVGLMIDLRMRASTENKKSLDDVMRHLYKTYVTDPAKDGKGWIGVGFPRDGILKALNDVSGMDWKPFYDGCISGTDDLPFAEVFKAAGFDFTRSSKVNDLGVPLRGRAVDRVASGSAAEKAGFKQGDRITAINGEKVDGVTFREMLNKLTPGKEVKVTVERGNPAEEVELKSTVALRDRPGAALKRNASATEIQKKIIDTWLTGE